MTRPVSLAAVTALLFASGCNAKPSAQPASDSARVAASAGNRFDPGTAQRGDSVVGLVLDSIARTRTPSGDWVGSARFIGVVTVSGHTFRHPDGDDYPFPCFEVDSSSALRLPRWAGDERRPWFCFENAAHAKDWIGGVTTDKPFVIVVDRFTINRSLSDAVNSARLIGGDRPIIAAGPVERSCFRTATSILARKPGTVAPGPAGLTGTLLLEGLTADSGAARLVDSDGRALGARWRRFGRDSILVVGFDDFMRVEMRLGTTDRTLRGAAVATSDAATERDSTGRMVSFRRAWTITTRPASCGEL